MNKVRQVIIDDLREHPKSTRQEIALRTGVAYSRVCRWLNKMHRDVIRHAGAMKTFSSREWRDT